jgi:hypothetical protein
MCSSDSENPTTTLARVFPALRAYPSSNYLFGKAWKINALPVSLRPTGIGSKRIGPVYQASVIGIATKNIVVKQRYKGGIVEATVFLLELRRNNEPVAQLEKCRTAFEGGGPILQAVSVWQSVQRRMIKPCDLRRLIVTQPKAFLNRRPRLFHVFR